MQIQTKQEQQKTTQNSSNNFHLRVNNTQNLAAAQTRPKTQRTSENKHYTESKPICTISRQHADNTYQNNNTIIKYDSNKSW